MKKLSTIQKREKLNTVFAADERGAQKEGVSLNQYALYKLAN